MRHIQQIYNTIEQLYKIRQTMTKYVYTNKTYKKYTKHVQQRYNNIQNIWTYLKICRRIPNAYKPYKIHIAKHIQPTCKTLNIYKNTKHIQQCTTIFSK